MIGSTIGQYRILEKLGEGGMGVVYKAEDVKLKRLVALKFLPHHVTASEEERARFLQEAQAIATLNHANVCTIFGIEEHDGNQFIEMEYVDGRTLRATIDTSPLSVGQAIEYGIQIGEALQEAHGKGIVHRDVKAENIMLNSRGQVKVMDFGLAKLRGALKLTRTSSTIGTLAYMAPEQIRGEEIDARSDIFSFGVVLYEMLTGTAPFRGEHDAAIMYSILNEEPARLESHRQDLPVELQHIVDNALEKDPEDRFQTVAEMVRELRRLKKHSSRVSRSHLSGMRAPAEAHPQATPIAATASVATIATAAEPAGESSKERFPSWGKLLAGAVVIAAAATALWQLLMPSVRLSEAMVFRPLTIPFNTIWYPALSPDGNWIAFAATDDKSVTEIYYMNAASGDVKQLTRDSVFKYTVDISPDGSQIVYSRRADRHVSFGGHILWLVSTLGGTPVKLTDSFATGGQFSPDGGQIGFFRYSQEASTLWIMDADGKGERIVTVDSIGGTREARISFSWSPDGRQVAWLRNYRGVDGIYQEIVLSDLKTGNERQLTFGGNNIDEVCWTAAGMLLFSSNRGGATNLWAIEESGGEPVQITKGPGPDIGVRASRDGRRVLYLQQATFGVIEIADRYGLEPRPITPGDQAVRGPVFSSDGSQLAYIADDPDPIKPRSSIYLIDAEGRNRRRILELNGFIRFVEWSPDGEHLAYYYRDSSWQVGVVAAAGSGRARSLGEGFLVGWLDGGTALNVSRSRTSWRVPLDGGKAEQILEDSVTLRSRSGATYRVTLDWHAKGQLWHAEREGKPRRLLHEGPLHRVRWHRDGERILFERQGKPWMLWIASGQMEPYPWKNPDIVSFSDVTTDGKRTVFVRDRTQSKLILIDNFME